MLSGEPRLSWRIYLGKKARCDLTPRHSLRGVCFILGYSDKAKLGHPHSPRFLMPLSTVHFMIGLGKTQVRVQLSPIRISKCWAKTVLCEQREIHTLHNGKKRSAGRRHQFRTPPAHKKSPRIKEKETKGLAHHGVQAQDEVPFHTHSFIS